MEKTFFTEKQIRAIKDCSLFRESNTDEVLNLLESENFCSIKDMEKESCIFHMEDTAGKTGIVLTGKVSVKKIMPNGSSISIAKKGPGDMIGEAAVFSKAKIYPCDLAAEENCCILFIPKDKMLILLQSQSIILENFLQELSTMTYTLQSKVEMLSYSGIAQKIAFYLLSRYRESGSSQITLPDSMTNFANILNVSRPSLHREFSMMQKRKFISVNHGTVEILNKDGLELLLQKRLK